MKYKTISVDEETFKQFEKLAGQYELSNKGLIEAMLKYFHATKSDPRSPREVNIVEAIKALDKRIIGFMKTQERDLLKPMATEIGSLQALVKKPIISERAVYVLALEKLLKIGKTTADFYEKRGEHGEATELKYGTLITIESLKEKIKNGDRL